MIAVFNTIMECGDAKKVDQLLAQLPQLSMINKTDYRARTALHLAVEYGLDDVVELLLGRGIDVLAKDCGGFTALHIAAELGYGKIVARQLHSPNLAHEKSHDGLTALHLAAIRGRVTIVKQLLQATCLELIDAKDKHGRSALHFAIEYGHEEIVEVLTRESAKSAKTSENMFHYAIQAGHDSVVARLLAQSPKLIDFGSHGEGHCSCSALEIAARKGHETIVMQLLAMRPNSTNVGGAYDGTVLHLAAECGLDTAVAHLLVDKPALISQVNSRGQTALHCATRSRCAKVVSQLLAKRSDLIDAVDRDGKTALHAALYGQGSFDAKSVACLLAHRPAVLDKEMFWHVLNHAKDESHDALCQLLLAYKPELVRSVENSGTTTLHRVFGYRTDWNTPYSKDLMRTVWKMTPEALHVSDASQETPFHIAVQRFNLFAIDLVRWKLSLDEIVDAFAHCSRPVPEDFLEDICECLLQALNKDVVGIVFCYFGDSLRVGDVANREKNKNTWQLPKKNSLAPRVYLAPFPSPSVRK